MMTYLDAITALGEGSSHPGGFFHTLNILKRVCLFDTDIVLDIGCGTGRTACHIAKNSDAFVFALDSSPEMLQKAGHRISQEGIQVELLHYPAEDTPFRDQVIDLITIESVLIFLSPQIVLQECNRILKKQGLLMCVEMCAGKFLPPIARKQIQTLCNLPHIPSFEEWLKIFQNADFTLIQAQKSAFPNLFDNIKNILYPDPYQVISSNIASSNSESGHKAITIINNYRRLIQIYNRHLGFATFLMRKNK